MQIGKYNLTIPQWVSAQRLCHTDIQEMDNLRLKVKVERNLKLLSIIRTNARPVGM